VPARKRRKGHKVPRARRYLRRPLVITREPFRVDIQFVARKRDGQRKPWRWCWGPYRELRTLDAALTMARASHGRKARIALMIRGRAVVISHELRTRAGMARARAEGRKLGRPRVRFDVAAARRAVAAGVEVRGRTWVLRAVARALGVSVSTLERALRAPSKRVAPKLGRNRGRGRSPADRGAPGGRALALGLEAAIALERGGTRGAA
jgi:hypothetical protein